ncbi:MAG: hypothetical protein PHV97_00600 [Candidatus Omnitrophica bacterium]|nr:hypothetical protein [Candidatus Omnitrophota bacterium]
MNGRVKNLPVPQKIPIVGRVKIGERDQYGTPRSLDYFKAAGPYAELFHGTLGPKPQLLWIAFPSNMPVISCQERLELRQGPKLYAEGDGEEFKVWDPAAEKYITANTKDHPDLMDRVLKKCNSTLKNPSKWNLVMSLRFFILNVKVGGAWQLDTKGEKSSIANIRTVFDETVQSIGDITRIPFSLTITMAKSQTPGSKNSFPVLNLASHLSKASERRYAALLESGHDLPTEYVTEKILKEETHEDIQAGGGERQEDQGGGHLPEGQEPRS